jgi:cadmium resistance protein CadD (predicted permease)
MKIWEKNQILNLWVARKMFDPSITFFWLKNQCKKDSSNINHNLSIIKRKFKNNFLTRHCFTIASNLDYVAFNLLFFLMLALTYPPIYILIIIPLICMLTYPPTHPPIFLELLGLGEILHEYLPWILVKKCEWCWKKC